MGFSKNRILWVFIVLVFCIFTLCVDLCFGGVGHVHSHHCNHGHDHDHHHLHHEEHQHQQSHYLDKEMKFGSKLPEELAEEEDLKLHGFGIHHGHDDHHHDHGASELSGVGLWINALGCSLLVSLASLVCLIILPVIFVQGKPSRAVVDSLALFGAGAMLGDAFLHQLPHAFGGGHSHSHDHLVEDDHHNDHEHRHSHAHSLKDLSVGLCVLAGIVVFLLVEKIVRYVEHNSGGHEVWGHGHHHHHGTNKKKLKDDEDEVDKHNGIESEISDEKADGSVDGEKLIQSEAVLRKRNTIGASKDEKTDLVIPNGSTTEVKSLIEKEPAQAPSNLVFGYLNLFSDGVHNFTDGMALGSAFLLYGSVGGWSRTLFLLAHELPQEVGDFGILVRSGFSVFKALFFNFLSALAALAGTALALLWGQDPGQSSLIEGFTAGGFIYIAVAGVLAEMNSNGSPSVKTTVIQLISLISGMAIALCISLLE